MGPLNKMRNPDIERALKRSSSGGCLLGWGLDWSWGPQSASVNGVVDFGQTGKWRKDSRCSLGLLEKVRPRSLVPLIYLMAYFAALRCPGDCFVWYWERRDVMVLRSFRVL